MRKLRSLLCALAPVLMVAVPTPAAAIGGSMVCTVASTTLPFNNYDPMSTSDDILPAGTITVSCTNTANAAVTVTYNLTLDVTTPRTLKTAAGDTLTYDLYINTPPSTLWDQTNKVTCSYSVPAKSANVQNSCTFYGKIGKGQDVPAGSYNNFPNGGGQPAVGGTYSCGTVLSGGC